VSGGRFPISGKPAPLAYGLLLTVLVFLRPDTCHLL
jgi:hypothetical protein